MCGDIPLSAQGGAEVSELCVCVGRGGGGVSECVRIHTRVHAWGSECRAECVGIYLLKEVLRLAGCRYYVVDKGLTS